MRRRLVAAPQSPIGARTPGKIASPGPSTLDGIDCSLLCLSLLRAHLLIGTQFSISPAESGSRASRISKTAEFNYGSVYLSTAIIEKDNEAWRQVWLSVVVSLREADQDGRAKQNL
jgi:hypothetical protein